MLISDRETKRNSFRVAIERVQEDGLSEAEMVSMITATTETQQATNGAHTKELADVIYEPGKLPEGLIDLPSAAKKYGIAGANAEDLDQPRQINAIWACSSQVSWRGLYCGARDRHRVLPRSSFEDG